MARPFKMLIGGRLVPGASAFPVINPSTGKAFAEAPSCSKEQLDEAVQAAQAAFPAWSAAGLATRKEAMLAAAGRVSTEMNNLSDLLVKEQGKPLASAKGEIAGVVHFMTQIARRNYAFETVLADNDRETVICKAVPLGVVGGITPWNFPPLMAAWKMAEALMTANTIVLKPSPHTPLTTLVLGEILADAFPPGVLNVVSGGDEVGRWISEHPGVAKISFTGSTRTGKAIQKASSDNLKRLTLELGGNDAAIILDDADPKAAARGVFQQAMANSGQICVSIKRLYVHETKYDEVLRELVALARAAKVGDGFERGVQYGPINNEMQFERVKDLVDDAKRSGATVHTGGEPLAREGYFYPPTILSGVAEGVRVVDEEQFGPVLPVLRFADTSEAIRRANASSYGLGASVWGRDVAKAAEVASQLQAGTVWINSHGALTPDVPFGGLKESGIGRQMGDATMASLTETKIIRIPKSKL